MTAQAGVSAPMSARPAASSPGADRFFAGTRRDSDPEIFAAIGQELARQQNEIELIASENIVSAAAQNGLAMNLIWTPK